MTERVIRFATFEPLVITAAEYEQIERDVIARAIAGDAGPGDRVLAALLRDHASRYQEIKG